MQSFQVLEYSSTPTSSTSTSVLQVLLVCSTGVLVLVRLYSRTKHVVKCDTRMRVNWLWRELKVHLVQCLVRWRMGRGCELDANHASRVNLETELLINLRVRCCAPPRPASAVPLAPASWAPYHTVPAVDEAFELRTLPAAIRGEQS